MLQILVSACLAGENCKWDGGSNRNEAVLRFMEEMKGKSPVSSHLSGAGRRASHAPPGVGDPVFRRKRLSIPRAGM